MNCINKRKQKRPPIFYFPALRLLIWFCYEIKRQIPDNKAMAVLMAENRKLYKNGSTFFQQQRHHKENNLPSSLLDMLYDTELCYLSHKFIGRKMLICLHPSGCHCQWELSVITTTAKGSPVHVDSQRWNVTVWMCWGLQPDSKLKILFMFLSFVWQIRA